jgi:3'-phosphoadenosine 5'-phosphosulfate sulfotransferase (PAPS reductase)/FAD synthetase
MEVWQVKQMQQLPLEVKILKTQQRIKEWYEYFDGDVYVSFSGGKDSVVLLNIARIMYPDIKAVYLDTGLEYPELREHVKTFDNVEWIKPKMHFTEVIKKYGYPLISKEQSQYIRQYRTAKSEKTKDTRWNGNRWGRGKISEKWKFLIDAPFKISDQCCDIMKKNPFKAYEKNTGLHPIIGSMASESAKRQQDYQRFGCNAFENKRPISKPLSFWTEHDILEYIQTYNLTIPSVYGEIIENEKGKLITTGVIRTGCMFCLYGVHMEPKDNNKFHKMKESHPKIYDYCINNLKIGEVLDYIDVEY